MFLFVACGGDKPTKVSTYDELVEALAGDSKVIQVVEDIEVSQSIVVNRKVTLDLNGKSITNIKGGIKEGELEEGQFNDFYTEDGDWSIISVREGGDLTIKGDGQVNGYWTFALDLRDGGIATIEEGKFVGCMQTVYVHAGELNVKGGSFDMSADSVEEDFEFEINAYDANFTAGTAKIVISGGEFVKFNPANCGAEGEGTNFLAEGYVSTAVEDAEVETYVVTKA